jgi:hypothetical protein
VALRPGHPRQNGLGRIGHLFEGIDQEAAEHHGQRVRGTSWRLGRKGEFWTSRFVANNHTEADRAKTVGLSSPSVLRRHGSLRSNRRLIPATLALMCVARHKPGSVVNGGLPHPWTQEVLTWHLPVVMKDQAQQVWTSADGPNWEPTDFTYGVGLELSSGFLYYSSDTISQVLFVSTDLKTWERADMGGVGMALPERSRHAGRRHRRGHDRVCRQRFRDGI